ncbi:MAG: ABC transporter permease [Proteobacteria bacterium]|nr:ABC transporter permease [Pseudomonadota bacterium]
MSAYIARRVLYALPILLGVNVITFFLFFVVNSPDDMARMHLGSKHVTPQAVENWKAERGYDKPLLWNAARDGLPRVTDTIFYRHTLKLFLFEFGQSDSGRDIAFDISQRMVPSLVVTLPVFVLELLLTISLALGIALLRGTYFDTWAVIVCVAMMSVSSLFYIIGGQFLFGKVLRLVPISGFDGDSAMLKFIALPVAVSVIAGLGYGTRWYRTLFLEEINRDYVRTARAKGLSERAVLFKHVLRNALIPILTGVVVILPTLFIGNLIIEAFFGIPGLGSYTIEAIQSQDFAIVRAMVFLGSLLYIVGLILTDISYTLADPRVRLT